jgi:hypothetical protein
MAMTETVSKINRILEGLMSCQLEFRPAGELVSGDWNLSELELRLDHESDVSPRFIECESSGDFGFPIHVDGSFAGLAVVKGNNGMKSERLVALADLLSEILQQQLHQQDRGVSTSALEERMKVLQFSDDEESNVIQIRPTRLERVREMIAMLEEDAAASTTIVDATSNPKTSLPLLIDANIEFPMQRLAIELHEASGRWAMLPLEDLASDILDSRESLKSLGGMTLFVRDLASLSEQKQTKLAEYLSTLPSGEMPHVIAGRSEGFILPRLLNLFCVTRLDLSAEVTRPQLEAAVTEILENARRTTVSKSANSVNMAPVHSMYFDPDQTTVH